MGQHTIEPKMPRHVTTHVTHTASGTTQSPAEGWAETGKCLTCTAVQSTSSMMGSMTWRKPDSGLMECYVKRICQETVCVRPGSFQVDSFRAPWFEGKFLAGILHTGHPGCWKDKLMDKA